MANMIKKRAALLAEATELQAKGAEMTSEELDRLNTVIDEVNSLSERIKAADEAEKLVKGFTVMSGEHKVTEAGAGSTWGERFVKSDAMRAARERFPKGVGEKQVDALRGLTVTVGKKADGDDAGDNGDGGTVANGSSVISRPAAGLPFQRFEPGIVNPLEHARRTTILDLITIGTTDAGSLRYRTVQAITNNAAIVPESLDVDGDQYLKPISTLELGQEVANDATYADGAYVTTQEWNDDGALRALIDTMLARNIRLTVEDMVLNGTGEDGQPLGILNATGLNEQEFDEDALTTVRKARAKLDANGYTASALVVSPNDAATLDMLQANNGTFYGGGPVAAGNIPTLWGVPVVVSPKVKDGEAIMGDWSSIHLLTIDPVNINVFDQHMDFAQRNLLYLRAEFRALQLLRAPAAFVKVSLGN